MFTLTACALQNAILPLMRVAGYGFFVPLSLAAHSAFRAQPHLIAAICTAVDQHIRAIHCLGYDPVDGNVG